MPDQEDGYVAVGQANGENIDALARPRAGPCEYPG